MAVWELACPQCGHRFRSLVLTGGTAPTVWVCGACGSREAQPTAVHDADPFTSGPGGSCGCGCG